MDKIATENGDEDLSNKQIIDKMSNSDNLRELASKNPPPDDWFDIDMECPF